MDLKKTKIQQEITFKNYSYLEEVLNYIRDLRNNVKGGISEDWYKVLPKEVSLMPCKISCFNVSLVVNFGRFIGKSLQQKFIFSKVAFSN